MTPSGTTQTPEQPDKEVEAALWRERCDGQILTTSGPQEVQRTRTSIALIFSKIRSVSDTIQGADKELSDWASSLSGQADFFLEHLRQAELSSLVWTLEHLCPRWRSAAPRVMPPELCGWLSVRNCFLFLVSSVVLTICSRIAEILDNQVHLSTMCAVNAPVTQSSSVLLPLADELEWNYSSEQIRRSTFPPMTPRTMHMPGQ